MIPVVPVPTSLYRLFGPGGELLYIGIAGNPGRRFEQHAGDKPWWGEVASLKVEHFVSRVEASVAEVAAIRAEAPRYNIQHSRLPGSPLPPDLVPPGPTRWRFESRRSGVEREGHLWLYGELDVSAAVGECDSTEGQDQLAFYVATLRRRYPEMLDAVPISWFVDSDCSVFEAAPYQSPESHGGRHFLTHYTWPVGPDGQEIDWFRLPVRIDRFPAFADALGWAPSPMQPFCPLRDILDSRHGRA